MHCHFATVCSRITRFSPKCSEKITVCQPMQNSYQLVKYSLINNRNCCARRHPACEHDTSESWRSTANKGKETDKDAAHFSTAVLARWRSSTYWRCCSTCLASSSITWYSSASATTRYRTSNWRRWARHPATTSSTWTSSTRPSCTSSRWSYSSSSTPSSFASCRSPRPTCRGVPSTISGKLSRIQTHTFPTYALHQPTGRTENARLENAGRSKMQGRKTRDWKTRHQTAGLENAGKGM